MTINRTSHRVRPRSWPVPAALMGLSAIPLAAGTLRVLQLAGGPHVMPADHRFSGFPTGLIVHIVGAAVFALTGAVQFVPRLRRRPHRWHRRAGRVVAAAGLLVAASALWLTVFYPPQPGTGHVLFVSRLIFGPLMGACLVLGFTAIRRRDIAAHRAWMIRAYALGLAAGTQALTGGITEAVFGTGTLSGDLAKVSGWLINLAVAEWVIRHRDHTHSRRRNPRRAACSSVAEPAGTPR